MKKIIGYSGLIVCQSFFLFVPKVNATEKGLLKIQPMIQKTQQPQDVQYIEQENSLSALFHLETTTRIQQQQSKTNLEEQRDKNKLFIQSRSSQRLVDAYIATLFTGQIHTTSIDNVTLTTAYSDFSLIRIAILLIVGGIMGYSVVRVLISKT